MTEEQAILEMKKATDNLMAMAKKLCEDKGLDFKDFLDEKEEETKKLCS